MSSLLKNEQINNSKIYDSMLFVSDRCELREPDQVQKCQDSMLELLHYILRKNHPRDPMCIAKVLMVATDLRNVKYLHHKQENRFTTHWINQMEFPPIFYEMWST